MILQPVMLSNIQGPHLAYVEFFKPGAGTISIQADGSKAHVPDDIIEMYRVKRMYRSSGVRFGEIIPLMNIWRQVQLVPKYGKSCPTNWTDNTATELATEFYVNCFSDKQTFQAVY